jgi:hypothetical protein
VAEFALMVIGKPKSLNSISQADHWARSKEAAAWRELTAWYLKSDRRVRDQGPLRPDYDIFVTHFYRSRPMDHGNVIIASKAMLDEIHARGVIVDDSPKYVRNLTYERPQKDTIDGIHIRIVEVDAAA